MSDKKHEFGYKSNLIVRSEEARTVRKIVIIIILSLTLLLLVAGGLGYVYVKSALKPVKIKSGEEVELMIPMGSSTSTIANLLEENGIIKNARIFRFYIKFKNESNFQAGEYIFTESLSLDEIIESLKSGKVMAQSLYKVTIPEGKNIDEIADIYSDELPFSKEAFLEKLNDPTYIQELIELYPSILSDVILDPEIRTPLEGYLYAATYDFYEKEPSVDTVIKTMLDKTVAVLAPYEEGLTEQDLTIHEVITFASLVENEAQTDDQRKKISGVFYNRLAEGMKLQTDPTVLYAQGEHKHKVLYKDLKIESPYNTYYIESLPIGPISNFSQNAFEATIHPEENDYIYFLHDKEGNIYYSATYDEHLEFKDKYIVND